MKPEIITLSDTEDLVEDANSYNSLRQPSCESCEFCDVLFSNRYSMLKHNLSHIIIPLIKQNTFRCDECLHHYTSADDLKTHIIIKHGNLVKNDYQDKLPEILQSLTEKQAYVKCEDELKEVFIKCSELKRNGLIDMESRNGPLEPHIKRELKRSLDEPEHSIKEAVSVEDCFNLKDEPLSATDEEKEPIRHRLLFEEDVDDNLFKDLSADCQVSLETLYEEINPTFDILQTFDAINFEGSGGRDMTVLNKIQEETTDLLRFGKAIHYDVLLEAEVCFCRLCGLDFPNRYSLLQHEPTHIKMKVKRFRSPPLCCICERYISGNYHNLRRHMVNNHPEQYEREINYNTDKCPKCHMMYHNYRKHLRLQHKLYLCSMCDVIFETEQMLLQHCCPKDGKKVKVIETKTVPTELRYISSLTVMKLCDMCFAFMKMYMQNRQNYEVIGEKTELGVRQICDKCNNKVFEVKLVQRKPVVKEFQKHRVKPMTNQERLKKMQNRLKMIKMRNKF